MKTEIIENPLPDTAAEVIQVLTEMNIDPALCTARVFNRDGKLHFRVLEPNTLEGFVAGPFKDATEMRAVLDEAKFIHF